MRTTRGMAVDGPKIKAMIRERGSKQWYVALKAGISTGHLSNVLSRSRATMPTIRAIADALGVKAEEIMREAES